MMNSNKILTVSYGTFSCTLEGFDDSFGTMKAIAEYFRDLAADDRYFGAEPPQPDAEMLARIAEREISRRVEAREQEGRIVLSAEPGVAAPLAAAVTAPVADAVAGVAADVDADIDAPASDVPVSEPVADAAATAEPEVTSAALDAAPSLADTAEEAEESQDDALDLMVQDAALTAPAQDDQGEVRDIAALTDTPVSLAVETPSADTPTEMISAEVTSGDEDTDAPDADVTSAVAQTLILENPLPAAMAVELNADDAQLSAEMVAEETTMADAQPVAEEGATDDSLDDDTSEDAADDIDFAAIAHATSDTQDLAPVAEVREAAEVAQADEVETQAPATTSDDDTLSAVESFFADANADREEADAVAQAADDDAPAEDVAEASSVAPDSIAAKLQRIRAVVSASQEDTGKSSLFEDEHAEAFAPETDIDDVADDAAPLSGPALIEDVVADLANADESDEAGPQDGDDIAQVLARLDEQTPGSAKQEEEDDLAAFLDSDTDADQDAEEPGENLFDTDDAADDPAPEAPAEPVTPRRARVIKVKRAQIEEALAQGQIEEIEEDATKVSNSSLSAQEEAELQAELDAVASELPEAPATQAPAAQAPKAQAPAPGEIKNDTLAETEADSAEPMVQVTNPPVADADVKRLMAEAENQMEEPEGSRRRNAFQHLKAAVMAKKADAGLGQTKGEDEGAFRSDLADVVVPRRPTAEGAPRVERPAPEPVTPLKLVAEQRVDASQAEAVPHPVRPRRVVQQETTAEVETDKTGTFADYAADMGAHSLPEMLEAAASYLSFVEGREQFSRPQLMNKVRQVQPAEFSREDGLRSFGQLLRAGKIEKRQGGRFTVTDDIGYRPDERAAG